MRPIETDGIRLASWFERLDHFELDAVRHCVGQTETGAVRHTATGLTRLSNGLLYPLIAIALLTVFGKPMLPAILVSAACVAIAHLIYPHVKAPCARVRPFERDPTIASLLKPLDRYSFPSGHAMTATAAFVPLSVAMPVLAPVSAALILLIGWARLAVGHHYPTDIAAGILMGGMIASPGAVWLGQG